MANKKSVAVDVAYPSRDYQCEEDCRTLQRAAEVMADRGRKSKAMKMFKKQHAGGQHMMNMLSNHKFKRG